MSGISVCPEDRTVLDEGRVRRNRYLLLSDQTLFMFAAGLLDVKTLLPAFVTGYSSSLVLVALLPAIRSGCNLLPQLFAAHIMRSHARKKPWLQAANLVRGLPLAVLASLLFVEPGAPAKAVLPLLY